MADHIVIRDGQERKKTSRRPYKFFKTVLDSIDDAICVIDVNNFGLVEANSVFLKMYGLKGQKVTGKTCYEVTHHRSEPCTPPNDACPLLDVLKTGEHSVAEHMHYGKDSEKIYVEVYISPIKGENGNITQVVHISRDITGRRQAEEQLKNRRDQLEQIVQERTAELTMARKKAEEEASISSALFGLANSISGLLDTKAILKEISKTTINLISTERTAILLRREEEKDYRAAVFHGWPEHLTPSINNLGKSDMPAINMLLQGKDVHISDTKTSGLIDVELVETFNLRAIILSPLITSEGVTGFIMAERQEPFSGRDRKVLKGIASSSAIAVENAMLYKESIETSAALARRMETIRITSEIDKTNLSSLSRKEILEVTADNIQKLIPADKVTIINLDEKGKGYFYEGELMPFGACSFMDSVIRSGRVVSVPDLLLYRHHGHVIVNFLRKGFGSLIAFPLFTKSARFGCIIMASKRVGAFDKDDISTGEKLTTQMSIALENARLYKDIKELFLSTLRALSQAIDAKSHWTSGHSDRVTSYAISLGREMELPNSEIEKLELAGLLHDIGKIGTYDIVLDKPEKLTDEEFDLVKKHPLKGVEILEDIKQLKDVLPIIRHHHEKVDGTGYPDGLKSDKIPLLARILCVADSYDSMTADRPYRPSPGKDFAISELKKCSGTQFDPDVVTIFLKIIEE